jgi:hypothetical protein
LYLSLRYPFQEIMWDGSSTRAIADVANPPLSTLQAKATRVPIFKSFGFRRGGRKAGMRSRVVSRIRETILDSLSDRDVLHQQIFAGSVSV